LRWHHNRTSILPLQTPKQKSDVRSSEHRLLKLPGALVS
jgi:hypothetical protein